MTRKPDYREALRDTMASTGWTVDAALIVDTTAERLAGRDADDERLEAIRAALWRVWRAHFEASGAY